ncbi:hypothetical protein EDB85DRAFT_1886769 [Lactarius pseudohatsudake]|nr:hypothetical protein EDB85DRAFT_1886769 [Lactarius pseudohatsudake]
MTRWVYPAFKTAFSPWRRFDDNVHCRWTNVGASISHTSGVPDRASTSSAGLQSSPGHPADYTKYRGPPVPLEDATANEDSNWPTGTSPGTEKATGSGRHHAQYRTFPNRWYKVRYSHPPSIPLATALDLLSISFPPWVLVLYTKSSLAYMETMSDEHTGSLKLNETNWVIVHGDQGQAYSTEALVSDLISRMRTDSTVETEEEMLTKLTKRTADKMTEARSELILRVEGKVEGS